MPRFLGVTSLHVVVKAHLFYRWSQINQIHTSQKRDKHHNTTSLYFDHRTFLSLHLLYFIQRTSLSFQINFTLCFSHSYRRKTFHYLIMANKKKSMTNGHTNGKVVTPIAAEKQYGFVELVIGVGGIYASLYILSLSLSKEKTTS